MTEIKVGNYLLDKREDAGVPSGELPELRVFLRDAAPYLKFALRAAQSLQRLLEEAKHLKRQDANEAFVPLVQLTRVLEGSNVQYHIRMSWDGVIFLDRDEGVVEPNSGRRARLCREVGVLIPLEPKDCIPDNDSCQSRRKDRGNHL
jgi:hypothetical protein